MKKIFLYIVYIFSFAQTFGYNNIQWADDVVEYTSELSQNRGSALQIIGEPSAMPSSGINFCAWTPVKNYRRLHEWIKVEFSKPIKVEMIFINENYNPGNVSEIFLYDENGKEYLVFSLNDSLRNSNKNKKLNLIKIKKTPYKVKYLKVQIPRKWMTDNVQIDAIGISEFYHEFDVRINRIEEKIEGAPEDLGANINSMAEELSPIISPDGKFLYFTREGHPQNIGRDKLQDVWGAIAINDSSFGEAFNLGAPINNMMPNYICSVTPDGNRIIVGNSYLPDGRMNIGVSQAEFNGVGWEMPKTIVIDSFYNNSKYAEFSLAPDGKTLFMSVERNDSYGGKDVYISFLQYTGTFSVPQNLGPDINTAEDDLGPFIAPDNQTLFFATKGFPGYGDVDIFLTRRLDSTWLHWSKPQNIGEPVNTTTWDGYFSIPASGEYAYFVSKKNSLNGSDIYRIKAPQSLKPRPTVIVEGKVIDNKTKQPIMAKIIYETLPSGKEVGIAYSNKLTGEYKIALPQGDKYGILATADGYISVNENIDLKKFDKTIELKKNLYLTPIEIGQTVALNNIFFEYDSHELLSESFPELNRLIAIMKQYTMIKVSITGHTDNIGAEQYNQQLSLLRAQSVKNYLIANGINQNRLIIKGYGSKKPTADNNEDAGRKLNRRVEFTILEK